MRTAAHERTEGTTDAADGRSKVKIVTDINNFFKLKRVKTDLLISASCTFSLNILLTIYNFRGFSTQGMNTIDFTSIISHIYTAAFLMGFFATTVGHRSAQTAKTGKLPFLHPGVLEEGWFQYIPAGVGIKTALFMAIAWGSVMGSTVACFVLVLWTSMGMDIETDSMNGWLYAFYSGVFGGGFGYCMLAVGMIQGSTNVPQRILLAYNQQVRGGATDWVSVFTDKTKGGLTMAKSPTEIFQAFTPSLWRRFCSTALSLAGLCTLLTYGWLSDGDGNLLPVHGRDHLIFDMVGSTSFAAIFVSMSNSWLLKYVEMGSIPYLIPDVFSWGFYRIIPNGFKSPFRILKLSCANSAWWAFTATACTVACSYTLWVDIAFSGRSYIIIKALYYVPLCFAVSTMSIAQIATPNEEEYAELQAYIENRPPLTANEDEVFYVEIHVESPSTI
ncbi:hypothetical protein N9O24_00965 [bacterium]|nr:hypothetical protein [bacterium]